MRLWGCKLIGFEGFSFARFQRFIEGVSFVRFWRFKLIDFEAFSCGRFLRVCSLQILRALPLQDFGVQTFYV